MFCEYCGNEIDDDAKFCPKCGTMQENATVQPIPAAQQEQTAQDYERSNASPKSRTVTALLAFFLGGLGIHRFYVGKVGTGFLQILLTCCFGLGCIWALIDFIIILCGNFKDKEGRLVSNWEAKY